MLTLGIETSCDETSAAVVEDGRHVLSCVIASSKNDFMRLGGVIPEDAARRQLESILPVLYQAMHDAGVTEKDLDLIAVASCPGLLGSLLVGTTTARVLSKVWNVPLVPVHHTLGHLSSTWLQEKADEKDLPVFPILTLSISGGHTDLWLRTDHINGKRLGSTRDDAAGEAFDKGAVMLGLPYPGGPALMQLAEAGKEDAYPFPLPLRNEKGFDFSFSGLKTSLKYLLACFSVPAMDLPSEQRSSIAASYQSAICAHLSHQVDAALSTFHDVQELHVVGGVSANTEVKRTLRLVGEKHRVLTRFPMNIRSCTDNGAMIAAAGYFLWKEQPTLNTSPFQTLATCDLQTILSA